MGKIARLIKKSVKKCKKVGVSGSNENVNVNDNDNVNVNEKESENLIFSQNCSIIKLNKGESRKKLVKSAKLFFTYL